MAPPLLSPLPLAGAFRAEVPRADASGVGVLGHSAGPLPQPTWTTWLVDWHLDPVLGVGLLLAAAVYLLGVRRLAERGVSWPVGRTATWLGGLLVVLYATAGGLATYDTTMFSAHMGQHMLLAMVAPVPLALAAPVTLALRVLPGGTGGPGRAPTGPRGLVVRVLHSRVARVLSHPLVAFTIFVANPFVLYFSPLYSYTLEHVWAHELLHVHFLVTGCLFFWTLVGVDPTPGRPSYPLRLLVVFAALPFHAFLGIAIMSSTALLAPEWYQGVSQALPWYSDPLGDQALGGGILWASGDIFGGLFLAVLFLQWSRDEERTAVRTDRRLDRDEVGSARRAARRQAALSDDADVDGGAAGTAQPRSRGEGELEAYNAYLQRLAVEAATRPDRPAGPSRRR